jgi:hypothetical protein
MKTKMSQSRVETRESSKPETTRSKEENSKYAIFNTKIDDDDALEMDGESSSVNRVKSFVSF